MPEIVITDNLMTAQRKFPGATIVSKIDDVILLPKGTAVRIHEIRQGLVIDGPCHTARVMIKNGLLSEVVK